MINVERTQHRLANRELKCQLLGLSVAKYTLEEIHTTNKERGWEERKIYLGLWCLFLINNI